MDGREGEGIGGVVQSVMACGMRYFPSLMCSATRLTAAGGGGGGGVCKGRPCERWCSGSCLASGCKQILPNNTVWAGFEALHVDGVYEGQAELMRRLPTSLRAAAGGKRSIPREVLQDVKAKMLIALILLYLIPLNGEVREWEGDPPMDVQNEFSGFVFEE